jgi:hypothetical protein
MSNRPVREMTEPVSFEEGIVPDEVGPFLPMTNYDVGWFNDMLVDEIESAYTSSVCCCDFCYDEFAARWPDVTFRDIEFQTQSIELFLLITNSRLPGVYTPAEISSLKRLVECPRCLGQAPHNVWIYEHRFSNATEIERSIDELLSIGCVTPFLLLEHPFAQRVLTIIRDRSKETLRAPLDFVFYRARLTEDVSRLGQAPDELQTYAAPPAAFVGEGRYNHAGMPMIYLASSADTAAAELGTPKKTCCVGKLRLVGPFLTLDLLDIDEDAPSGDILLALSRSALISAPRTGDGWIKRQYIFSRFVADCARAAGFDVIRYGSIKRSGQSNYVLLNPPDDFSSIAVFEGHQTVVSAHPGKRN